MPDLPRLWPVTLLGILLLVACPLTEPEPEEDGFTVLSSSVEPHPSLGLAALVSLELSEPGTALVSSWSGAVAARQTAPSGQGTAHRFLVLGMRAETTYNLQVLATSGEGHGAQGEVLSFVTAPLPDDIPDFEVTVLDPDHVQPGVTVFGPAQVGGPGNPSDDPPGPFLLGVDEEGEVVWYYDPGDITGNHVDRDARPSDDGSLLLPLRNALRLVTEDGETLAEYSGDNLHEQRIHHDGMQLPDGGTLALVNEERTLDIDGAPTEVKGDALVVWDAAGELSWQWSAFDHLPTDRFPGPLSQQTAGPSAALDWTHANGLDFDAEESLILISLRHQNWVVALRYPEGDVAWILGQDGDFPLTQGEWFYSQHLPVMLDDDRVLIYDNGNERDVGAGEPYSRAVIYSLEGGVAKQEWAWQTEHFTTFLGGASLLDNGNVLVCAGGQRTAGLPAQITEVAPGEPSEEVWKLTIYDRVIYRSRRLPLTGGPIL